MSALPQSRNQVG